MRNRPIIFLDFDGVIHTWVPSPVAGAPEVLGFKPAAVVALNGLLARCGGVLVATTSWRESMPVERLREFLMEAGVRGELIDATPLPLAPEEPHGQQIFRWLCNNDIRTTPFVILDDDMEIQPMSAWLVPVSHDDGLTARDVERAIAILGGAPFHPGEVHGLGWQHPVLG